MRLPLRWIAVCCFPLTAPFVPLAATAWASSSGVTRWGALAAVKAVELGCSVQPEAVYPGEPVVVAGSPLYLPAKAKPEWQWTASGGAAKATEDKVTIDTGGLAPGRYTVHGLVKAGSRPKDGAVCDVLFQVKGFDPPSLTCTAEPGSIVSGGKVVISATGSSPQRRQLTYSYATSAGEMAGSGRTVTLSTAGLGNTVVEITCSVRDDVGQTATFATRVTVAKPEEPVIPQTEELCVLQFNRDKRRPVRVDNEAKGCLDDIALRMVRQTDARLVMIGNASPDEDPAAAAQRVLNAREYLLAEKGVERSRLEVRVGETSGRSVRDVLVPSGASFSEPSTQPFEERAIPHAGEAYGRGGIQRRRVSAGATAQPKSL